MKLTLIKEGRSIEMTKYTGNYSRCDNIDSLGMEFSFDLAANYQEKYWPKELPEVGDKLIFENNEQNVFEGIITDESKNGFFSRNYKAYDYGFYLNKNEVIAQFNGMAGDAAIKKLCGDFNIPIGNIASIPTAIKKIYSGEVLSDCIRDILNQATDDSGQQYRLEVREGKLFIEKYTDLIVEAKYQPASNIASFNATVVPADVSGGKSMAEMKNIIKIVSSSEKDALVVAEARDDKGIGKFGMLQKVEFVDDKNSAQAGNIAKNQLAELNKIVQSQSVVLLGDDVVRSGRILAFNQPELEMTGQFLVANCTHHYTKAGHTMALELEMKA